MATQMLNLPGGLALAGAVLLVFGLVVVTIVRLPGYMARQEKRSQEQLEILRSLGQKRDSAQRSSGPVGKGR